MKTALSILFLIVFSLQILPVKEISQSLFKQELAEELGELGYDDTSENEPELKKIDEFTHSTYLQVHHLSQKFVRSSLLTSADYVFRQYIADTPTQPPNC